MRVLVIGGAGYIGSHAAHALRRRNHQVRIYDSLVTGHSCLADGFDLVVGDISDAPLLSKALQGVDAVMHFAAFAYVGESVRDPRKYFENNVRSALLMLNTVLDAGVKKFIFSSSCATYGMPEKVPIPDTTPRNPVNPYGATKLCFEHALSAYDAAYGIRSVCLRYFNAAGADESGRIGELHDPETHLIPLALQVAAGTNPYLTIFGNDYPTPDGTCIRDYIHVNDLAEAHVLAVEYLENGGKSECLNLGTGQGHSVKQVVEAVERITGRPVPCRIGTRRAGDPPILVADASRARSLLGWRPSRTFDDCVRAAWNWHLKVTNAP
ncbi:MAG: UDP-glucose 4-epimerase GalE [Terriglobales bacterium]